MHIFINNKFYPEKDAKISVFDHGLLYGDGVFETLRTYNGRVFKIDEHIERLFHSAKQINLEIPYKKSELKNAINSAIRKNKVREAYIRVTVTRGTGDIGYASKCIPNLIIIAKKFIPYPKKIYEKGVSVITYNAERFLPKAKSTNCLHLVMAKNEATKKNSFEAILVDNAGFVTEGTVSNVFFVKYLKKKISMKKFFSHDKNYRDCRIYTPKGNILCGITREVVIEIASRFIDVEEANIKKGHIPSFDECFLTNTTAEIVPVVKIDDKKIGNGFPGEITKKLMKEFQKQKNAFFRNAFF